MHHLTTPHPLPTHTHTPFDVVCVCVWQTAVNWPRAFKSHTSSQLETTAKLLATNCDDVDEEEDGGEVGGQEEYRVLCVGVQRLGQ